MEWGNVVSMINEQNRYNRVPKGREEDRKVMHIR
jgi:hypothetical protein